MQPLILPMAPCLPGNGFLISAFSPIIDMVAGFLGDAFNIVVPLMFLLAITTAIVTIMSKSSTRWIKAAVTVVALAAALVLGLIFLGSLLGWGLNQCPTSLFNVTTTVVD